MGPTVAPDPLGGSDGLVEPCLYFWGVRKKTHQVQSRKLWLILAQKYSEINPYIVALRHKSTFLYDLNSYGLI